MNVVVVIPARGGSKAIPRKNLRTLAGKPLIYFSIETALHSKHSPDVYLSSEDEEILSIAAKLGAKIHRRALNISEDETTLDPVIFDAYQAIAKKNNEKRYDLIITLQPTSPLLNYHTLDKAIDIMSNDPSIDTMIAGKNDTHLRWKKEGDRYIPDYEKRLNRQFLRPTFRETGAFLITRPSVIREYNRIGNKVELFLLEGAESIDIDSYEDWSLCEYYIKRKKILFVVSGNTDVGLGHVYNTLLVANDILDHRISFLVDKTSDLAMRAISDKNYEVRKQRKENLIDDIKEAQPDVVINDILDTDISYIEGLKNEGIIVINFEDLGEGAQKADLVINAIYPEKLLSPNHYYGVGYFVIRDEFILTTPREPREKTRNVTLTFGGVDPNNLTVKVLESIYDYCIEKQIRIDIVTGFGYKQQKTLAKFSEAIIHHNASSISDLMNSADVIFTSAGRTIYEVASLGIPAIVLAQNEREMTHFFASRKHGFEHLGLGEKVSRESITASFITIAESLEKRLAMTRAMRSIDLFSGRQRVRGLIRRTLDDA